MARSEAEARTYRFHPLPRRGVVVGLGPTQLAVVVVGLLGALVAFRSLPGSAGAAAAVAVVAAAAAAACAPVAGRTAVEWAPIAGAWLARRPRRRSLWRPGFTLAPWAVSVLEAPDAPGEPALGVVRDRRSGTWSAVLPVDSRAFVLLDPSDKQRRLAAWGAVLAATARPGTAVQRVQWIERASAASSGSLVSYLAEASAPEGCPPASAEARASYQRLVEDAGSGSQAHQVLIALGVQPRKASRALRSFGGGVAGACALLRREVRLLQGQLRSAELTPGRPLDAAGLAGVMRGTARPERPAGAASAAANAWPMAIEEGWASVRVDGGWHATFWVAEWPRVDVGADFLAPLLLAGGSRVVSVVMEPVPAGRARREAESARTADVADEELRRRAGFLSTASRQRQAEGVVAREAELANGHADYRFAGYVTVSADTPADLEESCAAVEQAAQQSFLELRRLYGQQREAQTWTLPLCRGLP